VHKKLLTVVAIVAGLLIASPSADAARKHDTNVKAVVALGAKKPGKGGATKHKNKHKKKRKTKAKTAAVPCTNTDVMPTAENLELVRAALLCLHNKIRAEAGLPAHKDNAKLRKAALGQSADMVSNGYFDHTSLDGDTFVDRILGVGYAKKTDGWTLGENLAWGTGDLSTPQGLMNAWMNSSGHKANILKKAYRELGIGIRLGVPTDSGVGATVTADFGVKL
jgi:uncharacterized protein YkwD